MLLKGEIRSTSTLNGEIIGQHCTYWSDTYLHCTKEGHTENPQKLCVWVGILNIQLVGLVFIDRDTEAKF